MGGAKMQDYTGICPLTSLYIVSDDPKDINTQSRNHWFPLNFYLCKETKETTKFHAPMGQFFKDCGDPLTNLLVGTMGLDVGCNQQQHVRDLEAFDKGGAFKVKHLPCNNCTILSEDLAEPNQNICDQWCRALQSSSSHR
eukprot:scaffold210768_cov66-Attheya_sp.AAC.4